MTGAHVKLDSEIAAIGQLSRDQLAARWSKIYGDDPPAIRRELLSHAVAWNVQARRLGGYSPETKRRLKHAIAKLANNLLFDHTPRDTVDPTAATVGGAMSVALPSTPASTPSGGARLIREWNGHTNVVDVVEGGYLFEGELHRSLSAVARKITKAHWSGPRFFGL